MNRDVNTRSALLAIARHRRVTRALAHAYLNRGVAMPTLKSSLGYMMSTGCITFDDRARGHRMSVLGVSSSEGVVYVVEELGANEAPIVYRLFLSGPRQGHLVPIHSWYEDCDHIDEIRARIDAIEPHLEPAIPATTEAWMLSTRIVQRRALRVVDRNSAPIRKFALQLSVEPVSGMGPSGKSTVTAFLRPNAELTSVWNVGDAAVARVTFSGIPSGLGVPKDTVILLTDRVG